MYRLNISYKQFHMTLSEIWLYEGDPNAPSTSSETGGKQRQLSIRGWRNWSWIIICDTSNFIQTKTWLVLDSVVIYLNQPRSSVFFHANMARFRNLLHVWHKLIDNVLYH